MKKTSKYITTALMLTVLLVMPVLLVQEPSGAQTTTPTINITSPADGSTVSGLVHLSADVNDSTEGVDRVYFRFEEDPYHSYGAGEDSGVKATYVGDWNSSNVQASQTAEVSGTLHAVAFDDGVRVAESDPISLTLDNRRVFTIDSIERTPTKAPYGDYQGTYMVDVTFTKLLPGLEIYGFEATVDGASQDPYSDWDFEFTPGSTEGTGTATVYMYLGSAANDAGEHTLHLRYSDSGGESQPVDKVFTASPYVAAQSPTVKFITPEPYPGEEEGIYINGDGPLALSAEATDPDGDLQYVEFKYSEWGAGSETLLVRDPDPPYTFDWDLKTPPVGSGGNLSVYAEDSLGNGSWSGDQYRQVNVDRVAPTVTIDAIDEATQPGTYEAVFTVEDPEENSFNSLRDYAEYKIDNAAEWTKVSFDPPWDSWQVPLALPTDLSVGSHTLYVRGIDKAGNESAVASQQFTVRKGYEWGNYSEYNGHGYASVYVPGGAGLPPTGMAWSEARDAAISEGEIYGERAQLVTIDIRAEQDWLSNPARLWFQDLPANTFTTGDEMWIGLNKPSSDWVWASGESLVSTKYTNWARSEPQSGDSYASMTPGGKWTGRTATDPVLLPALVEFYIAPYASDFGPDTSTAKLTAQPWVDWNEDVTPETVVGTLQRQTATGAWAPVAIRPLRYEASTDTSVMTPAKRLRPATTYKVRFEAIDKDGTSGYEEWEFRTRS